MGGSRKSRTRGWKTGRTQTTEGQLAEEGDRVVLQAREEAREDGLEGEGA